MPAIDNAPKSVKKKANKASLIDATIELKKLHSTPETRNTKVKLLEQHTF